MKRCNICFFILLVVRDLLYKRDKGKQIKSAVLLINAVGQPSGPGDLLLSKFVSLDNTNCGVITN